jgi:hypothetical protein
MLHLRSRPPLTSAPLTVKRRRVKPLSRLQWERSHVERVASRCRRGHARCQRQRRRPRRRRAPQQRARRVGGDDRWDAREFPAVHRLLRQAHEPAGRKLVDTHLCSEPRLRVGSCERDRAQPFRSTPVVASGETSTSAASSSRCAAHAPCEATCAPFRPGRRVQEPLPRNSHLERMTHLVGRARQVNHHAHLETFAHRVSLIPIPFSLAARSRSPSSPFRGTLGRLTRPLARRVRTSGGDGGGSSGRKRMQQTEAQEGERP